MLLDRYVHFLKNIKCLRLDISTTEFISTEDLPTGYSLETFEISSESTEYSSTVMIDNDISLSESVMYQTGNQNYFIFSVTIGLSITIACLLSCCLCICYGYIKKRGQIWAINHQNRWQKYAKLNKRNKGIKNG